jgi:hypothetical protein
VGTMNTKRWGMGLLIAASVVLVGGYLLAVFADVTFIPFLAIGLVGSWLVRRQSVERRARPIPQTDPNPGRRTPSTWKPMLGDDPAILGGLAATRAEFGLNPDAVLHFGKYGHERRVRMAQMVGILPITAFSVVLCKKAGPEKRPWSSDRLYNWMIRLALERVHGSSGVETFTDRSRSNIRRGPTQPRRMST